MTAKHNPLIDPLKTAFLADEVLQTKIPESLTERFSMHTEPTVGEDGAPLIIVYAEEGAIGELKEAISSPMRFMRDVGGSLHITMVNVEFKPMQA